MRKSGLADSPLFIQARKSDETPLPDKPVMIERKVNGTSSRKRDVNPVRKTRNHNTKQSRHHGTEQSSNHETMASRYHDTVIEEVRKAVKELGKEAATHRFTVEEKKALSDIIYAYKNRGIKTSENEITRIAINYILSDYRKSSKNSILNRVLRVLNG
jgi:hypothetical protein